MSMMFPESDILKILTGRKDMTCRPYPLEIGKKCIFMSNFKVFAVVEITAVTYIEDITKINHTMVKRLGFKTRKEYLSQNYNIDNDSKERYAIEFKVVENEIKNYIDKWDGVKKE